MKRRGGDFRFCKLLGFGLLASLVVLGCSDSAPEPTGAILHPQFDYGCPEQPCHPPTPEEEDAIRAAVENMWGDDAVCMEVKSAVLDALDNGTIKMGDYDGVTYWTGGSHPSDTYDFTEVGEDFLNWPPLWPEYILAHEFIHSSQHAHMDQEDWVSDKAWECVNG